MFRPQDQSFWYVQQGEPRRLLKNVSADVVVIGGGMAGLTAAQFFHAQGKEVVLLEQYFCGAGATGKSSGFITPNAEIGLNSLAHKVGDHNAQKLWNFVIGGVKIIEENIKKYNLSCHFEVQDTCILANSTRAFTHDIRDEHEAYKRLGFASMLYDKQGVTTLVGSEKYYGAQVYGSTFGINAYAYCQGMKKILQQQGVTIFEETPATAIGADGVQTPHGQVKAHHIVVCVDRFIPCLQKNLGTKVFPVQTFIMVSEPLADKDIKKIFPEKKLLCWDSELIYTYFRIIQDNRFLIGGSDVFSAMSGREQHNNQRIAHKLAQYVRSTFPQVKMNFEYFWPGLIGTSKDLRPVAGFDPNVPHVYYIAGATGLPWAAALGRYSAEKIVNKAQDFDEYFSFDRSFPIGSLAQSIVGKRVAFGLSNLITLKM